LYFIAKTCTEVAKTPSRSINVKATCSVDQIKTFIERSVAVKVVSCFEVRPRRRRNDDDDAVNRKAFRVCVYDDDRQRLLNATAWPDSVVVSEWYFKQKTERSDNGQEKRRRIGSNEKQTSSQSTAVQRATDVISAVADVSVYSDNSEVRVVDIGDDDDDGAENHTDADDTIIDICKNQSDGV